MIEINKICEELENVKTVAISGHIRPDGDCVGSCMGLYLYLNNNFPQLERITVYLQEIPESYHIISGTDQICHNCDGNESYDLFIALDCGDLGRLGDAAKYFQSAKKTICYDHHISNNGFADIDYVDPSISSTSELVYHVMDPGKITKEIAEALYMGIAHDTGIFQYSCTSPHTMEVAADLMRKGIDCSYIIDTTYMEKTYVQNQILGRALLESIMVLDGRCIISAIKKKDMKFYGVGPSDLDGIVSQMRLTRGVEVAIFLYETNLQEYKVSLRSKSYVDVSKVAQYFGGGGHVRAAGCTMHGSIHDVINNRTLQIEKQMKYQMKTQETNERQ